MPPIVFASLILTVLVAGAATVALVYWTGVPLAALGILALGASLWPGLRRRG